MISIREITYSLDGSSHIEDGSSHIEVWTDVDEGEFQGRCIGSGPDLATALNHAVIELLRDLKELASLQNKKLQPMCVEALLIQ